jgi:tetratricopeptide (TPR) repeat protein
LITAREYLEAAAHHFEGWASSGGRSVMLRNLAECLLWLGDVGPAHEAAAMAVDEARSDDLQIMKAVTCRGHMAMATGDSRVAERHFLSADLGHLSIKRGKHLYALGGVWWGEFLARTSRSGPSRRLTDLHREIVADRGWNEDVARCDRLLARLDIAAEDLTTAEQRLTAAAATFRDGDVLLELAETLPVLAECARASGDLETAARHVDEALDITGPRGLLLSHATALTVRARICADRVAAGSRQHLESGRDAADAAHRIATRRQLAWQWLDALDAHARLDQAEGVNRSWAERAAEQRARLIPAGLDQDPLTTVERQAAQQYAPRQGVNE